MYGTTQYNPEQVTATVQQVETTYNEVMDSVGSMGVAVVIALILLALIGWWSSQ